MALELIAREIALTKYKQRPTLQWNAITHEHCTRQHRNNCDLTYIIA